MEKVLAAGADQFGGEECVEVLLDLVRTGRVDEARVDVSARRLLAVKFRLGLFDDPYVDVDAAAQLAGLPEDVEEGHRTQARSTVLLANRGVLPLRPGVRVYVEGMDPGAAASFATVVARPADADLELVRLSCPFEPRDDPLA